LKILFVFLGAMVPPLLISLLLKEPIFSFSKGDVESWIAFWGSYAGALIGAATVYLVTNLQVKEQRKIQIQAIKAEHENALKREMKQFHFKNEIEKIEEFHDLLEDTLDSVSKCVNEFTKYITYTHILYGGHDEYTEEEEKAFKEEIRSLHSEVYHWIHKLTKTVLKMNRLTAYIEDTSQPVADICRQIEEFVDELRSGYSDKHSYKKYTNPSIPPLEHHLHEFSQAIMLLKVRVLEPKQNEKISEMKRHSNL
jgi:gas vesicle protein